MKSNKINLVAKVYGFLLAILLLGACKKEDNNAPVTYEDVVADFASMSVSGVTDNGITSVSITFGNRNIYFSNANFNADPDATIAITQADFSTDSSILSRYGIESVELNNLKSPINIVVTFRHPEKAGMKSLTIRNLTKELVWVGEPKAIQFTSAAQAAAKFPDGKNFIKNKNTVIATISFMIS